MTTAALNTYTGGQLTWTSEQGHSVRMPVVIRPVALAAPAEVSSTGSAVSYPVNFGYTGAFTAAARGLVPAALTAGTVADDPTDSACSLSSPNAQLIPVAIAAGTTYARFSLFDADVNPGSDIDLCVYRGATLVGSSGSGTSAEAGEPGSTRPQATTRSWCRAGAWPARHRSSSTRGSSIRRDAGNMTVSAPASATLGATGTINLTFNGLTAGTKYLGSVAYSGVAGMPTPTIVRVDIQ